MGAARRRRLGGLLWLAHLPHASQRQWLTFGLVAPAPLVPAYAKKGLMNEAMAGNAASFAAHDHDLATQRLALTVSEPRKAFTHRAQRPNLAAEPNAWTRWAAGPTLCFYRPRATYPQVGVQLGAPRATVADACRARLPVPPAPPSTQETQP